MIIPGLYDSVTDTVCHRRSVTDPLMRCEYASKRRVDDIQEDASVEYSVLGKYRLVFKQRGEKKGKRDGINPAFF